MAQYRKEGNFEKPASTFNGIAMLLVLLALNDQGAARYNAAVAQELADLGAPAFACTPEQFADLMARALNEQWR